MATGTIAAMPFDLDLVRHALKTARRNGFTEVELAVGPDSFQAKLRPMAGGGVALEEPERAEPPLGTISATLVGYYREAKNPLQVGQQVRAGDVVAVIAALGIANDVESKVAGEVVEVLVTPDQPVEFGQPLARVKPQ